MSYTRIVSLPKHDRVLVGRDIGEVFKRGVVYGFRRVSDEIICFELGETSLSPNNTDFPSQFSMVGDIVKDSFYLITKEESGEL